MTLKESKIADTEPLLLGDIEARIGKLNKEAREWSGQRLYSIGTAITKIGVGSLLTVDAINPVLHLWSQQATRPDLLGLIFGAAVVAWGFRDAGHVSYDFAQARTLNEQVTTLRSALTRRYEEAINKIPDSEFTR